MHVYARLSLSLSLSLFLSLSLSLSLSISLNLCLCACVYRVCVFEREGVCGCALPAAPGKPVRKAEYLDALRIRLFCNFFWIRCD
jgi:hypothetical protein